MHKHIFATLPKRNKPLQHFALVMLLWSLAEGVLLFYIPIFVEEKLASLVLVGLFLALNSFSSVVTDLFFGFVTELHDYRKYFYAAIFCGLLIVPLLMFGSGVWPVLAVVLLWGAQYELFLRFGTTIFIADNSSKRQFTSTSGVFIALRSLGFFVGPVLANALLNINEFAIGVTILIINLVNLGWMWLSMKDLQMYKNKIGQRVRKMTIWKEWQILHKNFGQTFPYLILGFGIAALETVFYVFGPIAFTQATDKGGLVMSLCLIMLVIAPPLVTSLVERKKPRTKVIIMAAAIAAMVSFYFELSYSLWLILPSVVVIFAAIGVLWVAHDTMVLEFLSGVRQDEEDEVVSMNAIGANTGYIVTALAGGFLMANYGFESVLLLGGVVLMGSVLLFLAAKNAADNVATYKHNKSNHTPTK